MAYNKTNESNRMIIQSVYGSSHTACFGLTIIRRTHTNNKHITSLLSNMVEVDALFTVFKLNVFVLGANI
jgi:hypothetical protein